MKGLRDDVTPFAFRVGDDFFGAGEAVEIRHAALEVALTVTRVGDRDFDLLFSIRGQLTIPCDLCLDDMQQPVEAEERVAVTLGDRYAEDDDLITVDEREGMIDVSELIREFVMLHIPIRHVHAPGKCDPAMMRVLSAHSAARSDDGEETADDRWAALRDIKTEE